MCTLVRFVLRRVSVLAPGCNATMGVGVSPLNREWDFYSRHKAHLRGRGSHLVRHSLAGLGRQRAIHQLTPGGSSSCEQGAGEHTFIHFRPSRSGTDARQPFSFPVKGDCIPHLFPSFLRRHDTEVDHVDGPGWNKRRHHLLGLSWADHSRLEN